MESAKRAELRRLERDLQKVVALRRDQPLPRRAGRGLSPPCFLWAACPAHAPRQLQLRLCPNKESGCAAREPRDRHPPTGTRPVGARGWVGRV